MLPNARLRIVLNPFSIVGLKTMNSSGLTLPPTIFSPRPQMEVMSTSSLDPESVSMLNITPLALLSLRTIFCTPTERATAKWSNPRLAR